MIRSRAQTKDMYQSAVVSKHSPGNMSNIQSKYTQTHIHAIYLFRLTRQHEKHPLASTRAHHNPIFVNRVCWCASCVRVCVSHPFWPSHLQCMKYTTSDSRARFVCQITCERGCRRRRHNLLKGFRCLSKINVRNSAKNNSKMLPLTGWLCAGSRKIPLQSMCYSISRQLENWRAFYVHD